MLPKISIITVTYNSVQTLKDSIESILAQDYPQIEYIIIDGASTDGTVELIKSYGDKVSKFISEPDRGMFDAMNKGVILATSDIIGILNSDDFYESNNIISTVVAEFDRSQVDGVFGDLVYVDRDNIQRIVRYYSSANCTPANFAYGWTPAHPTFFVKKSVYNRYGLFKTDYKIASDFELMARFLAKGQISYTYLPKVMVRMRMGGLSTKNFISNWIISQEIVRACSENGIKTNLAKVLSKYLTKVFQLVVRPKIETPTPIYSRYSHESDSEIVRASSATKIEQFVYLSSTPASSAESSHSQL
jgi:glycosyltransferase involved in cell wall biosynthesis